MGQNDIRLMEAAIALVEELNFSRAAQKLHITQPALTKRISELEEPSWHSALSPGSPGG
jgi:DNA-binding transcriptional LysR family regulator